MTGILMGAAGLCAGAGVFFGARAYIGGTWWGKTLSFAAASIAWKLTGDYLEKHFRRADPDQPYP
jgi:hypothetical protein